MKAALPCQETQRLSALRQYRILDTINEAAFDDLTRLAAQICGTPIALISLIDESRQWFKSKIGLDVNEISRDVAFCAHAILQPNSIFIVSDTLLDHQFATNPLVTSDPNIRFYAGVPLVTSDGYALGTLCVIDRVPRQLTPEQVEALHTLSRQVIAQLDLKLNLHKLERITIDESQHIGNLISALSHHMRTPLLATRGTLRAMLGGAFGSINHTWREVFENFHSSNEEILKLVETLLNVSRYTSKFGKSLSCDIINWKTIFASSIKSSNNTSKKKCEITCKIDPSLPSICGDEFEIQQVVQNLLDHAVLWSDHSGQVTLEVAPLGFDNIKVSVHCYGLEIAKEEKKKLFDHFSQAQNRRGKAELGLYFCRLIVEAHGGIINVESNLSDGNTFWFTLPVVPNPSHTSYTNCKQCGAGHECLS